MFYSLTGTVVYTDTQSLAVECGGVAYRCFTSVSTLKKTGGVGSKATLYTHLSVREDALELYGFADTEELEFFKLLIGVSGVGPKAAIAVLSEHTPASLTVSIASGDIKAITRAQGVGPKIAQRIILELKDKMGKLMPTHMPSEELGGTVISTGMGNQSEAVSALIALGFSQTQASDAMRGLDAGLSVEELLRQALKKLSGR